MSLLSTSSDLADADSNGDEAPRAYIMPQNADKATPALAEAIKAWLAERVSKHKRLEGGVHFIDAVPKNPVSVVKPWMDVADECSLARSSASCCESRRRWRTRARSCELCGWVEVSGDKVVVRW